MNTPSEFVLSRLSRTLYQAFLDRAGSLGYSFVRFQDLAPGCPALPERYIALRHDIDFAPRYSLEMAELEHDAGIASTYFVLVDGQFYNPLSANIARQLRRIRSLGHEIGLHFAVSSAVGRDIGEEVAFRLEVLSAIVGARVQSYSQHDPVNAGFVSVALPPGHTPCVDASEAIRAHNLTYVSDSAMMWRRHTFESALELDQNLCLLAHPHSWLHPQDDYIAMIREFEGEQIREATAPFDAFVGALAGYYKRRLDEGV
jgi:hypothetical protein